MELHQLRYFVAVAETSSFSRAAEHCHIAQPSLSQQMRKLEQELDQRLFDRLSRGVALTDAGRALLPRARRILAEVNAVGTALDAELHEGHGRLLVGAIPTMAPYLLPPLLKRFLRRFPDSSLTLREDLTDRLIEAVLDHQLDLAVMSTPVDNEILQLEVLGRERLLLATAPDFKLPRQAAKLELRDLRDQPAVVLHEMHCLGQQIESFCAAGRVSRRITCRSTQLQTVQHLVALGLGISIVPEMCARADTTRARRYHAIGRRGPHREIAVVYRVDRTVSRLARAFIEMLREDLDQARHAFPVPGKRVSK